MASLFSSTTISAGRCSRTRFLLSVLFLLAAPLVADVCVWRDPERTMQRIFPVARDYKTITIKMTPARVAAVEKQLGATLDDSERVEFNFYDVTGVLHGAPQTIGTVIALAGRGEYGAIEVVIGVDKAGRVVGTYIQRSRERVTHALESSVFLEQFKGKTKDDSFEVGQAIKPAAPEAEAASRVVALLIRKMLVLRDVLQERRVSS